MELSRFQIADYNADVGTLSVRIAKGGKVRHVILTEEASDVVDRLVAGRSPEEPLLRRDNGRAWKRAEQVRARPARAPASCRRSASTCCGIPMARCSPCGRCPWR
jgi:integrase